MTTKVRFSGTIIFTCPETDVTWHIDYHGYYVPAVIRKDADNSYPAEWDLELDDLPLELSDYEELIRNDILTYESQMIGA